MGLGTKLAKATGLKSVGKAIGWTDWGQKAATYGGLGVVGGLLADNWTEVRRPLMYAGAAAASVATGNPYPLLAVAGGDMLHQQDKAQKAQMAAEQTAADRAAQAAYNASLQPAATPTTTQEQASMADANYADENRRRFTFSRTVRNRSLLGQSMNATRTTIG